MIPDDPTQTIPPQEDPADSAPSPPPPGIANQCPYCAKPCPDGIENHILACQGSMRAYYYEFERTGDIHVDAILSAVAKAGKASHGTEYWDEGGWIDLIQAAANRAARVRGEGDG